MHDMYTTDNMCNIDYNKSYTHYDCFSESLISHFRSTSPYVAYHTHAFKYLGRNLHFWAGMPISAPIK